ncbi:MAG TPA: DUF6519 domain-containing protein [Vicinamibacterales bacterium]|nr:DUF6519 domain-containing protein [Vicinamibacterales bacterium]
MTGDFTRSTFRAANHYSKVRAQQGRGVLDAELNEQADIAAHVGRTTGIDVVGLTGAPYHEPTTFRNFQVRADASGRDLLIAPGRIYVNGILCENDVDGLRYLAQVDLPGAALPQAGGFYAVYLDVWERHITASEQTADGYPQIRDAALGGADTASRVRVIWQVKFAPVQAGACGAFVPPAAPTGKLRASEVKGTPAANDCLVPAGGGYRRLENQLYRVEVHATGIRPSFKWSRDNASTVSKVRSADQNAGIIVVEDAGRDDVIGFAGARFVELTSESLVLNGAAGVLLEVDSVTGTSIRVKNPANASLALGVNPIARRWDGMSDLGAATPVDLEDGVQVEFDGGTFGVGDYWLIPARTLTGKVEWPRNGGGAPLFEARHGTRHHYAPLAIVSLTGTTLAVTQDCRALFPPLTAIKASDVRYQPGACSALQGADTVQEALDTLCQSTGGDEPGIHVKGVVLAGGDALANDTMIAPADILKGIRIDCDERLFEGSVVNKHGLPNPVCSVTVELPWPLRGEERQFWNVDAGAIVGFQPVALAGELVVRENVIQWTPLGPTQKWLSDRLLQMIQEMTSNQTPVVLVRLQLRGNFIWGPEREPKLYLDGEAFGVPGGDNVDVRLPGGNRRRGGDFELWFWLGRPVRRVVPGVGVIPGRTSRFFAPTATAPSPRGQATGKDVLQLAIDRSSADLRRILPSGYDVDATQRFNATEAATAARALGVPRLTVFIGESFERLGRLLVEQLQATLRIGIAAETVPEAQMPDRIRAAGANNAAPDFVVGDEALAARLQRMDYSSDFIRI